jgi:hypothetical protein
MKNLYGTTVLVFILLNSYAQSCPGLGVSTTSVGITLPGLQLLTLLLIQTYPKILPYQEPIPFLKYLLIVEIISE